MNSMTNRPRTLWQGRGWLLVFGCAALIGPGARAAGAQEKKPATAPAAAPASTAPATAAADTAKLPMAQIEALVAPIALYPDPLLAQTLVASTYPLEIIQLQQWMAKHPGLKDKALADSVAKQPWDPSIQSMAAVPEVVKRLADDIQWTTELGNAFLSQQTDVMNAVQAMRKKAVDKGALTSNEQQTVDTQVVEKQTVIVVQPTNPEVVYVPSYSPTVVYGPPVYYPYPPIYYPPYPPGAAFVSFSIGMMWGAAIWGGPCCGAGWGGNNIYINNNNNFNKINHYNGGGGRGNNNWQHNPSHRGGTPYPNNRTADRFGGQGGGRQGAGASQRPAGGAGAAGGRGPTAGTQPAGGAGQRGGAGARPSAGTQPAGGVGGGGRQAPTASVQPGGGTRGDQIGGRDVPSSRGGQSGFSGGQGGYSGASARASSSRGASSMGGYGGGGRSGGGGARGGGGRGGGGRR